MPQWTTTPPPDPAGQNYRLVRTPASRPLTLILTSPDLIGCPTHYYRHRTTPCEGENCAPCQEGYSWRWHGYMSAMDPRTGEHLLLELTAQACDELRAYRQRHGTLRGCYIQATRANDRPNGRVCIRTKPADLTVLTLPEPPDVTKLLCHMWDVPTKAAASDGIVKGHPALRVRHPHHVSTAIDALIPAGNGQ